VSDYADLEDLIDTWHEQQDEVFQQSLMKARQEIKAGKVATLDDLKRDLQTKEAKERRTPKRS
jgi:hypothetical protein